MSTTASVDPAAIDALFAPYDRTDAPGFAVGIAVGGTPKYRRGFGSASVELPVALSPTIRMRIGSTSKHFCALAVMLLAEEGKLSIDDSPRTHLPELPPWGDRMTLRQLMNHTSGMRDSLDIVFHTAGPGAPVAPDAQLRMLSTIDSVNFPPGTDWNYNNGGYVLLSEIVERLSNQDFGAFLRARIFEPVGMYDTMLRELDTDLVPNSATLHIPRSSGGYTRGVFGPPIKGEGGIVSTVDDMLKWLKHMSVPRVGSADTWRSMRTPLTTHGYGLGLLINEHRGQRTVHHAGGVIGGSSQMIKFIDQELDIILMTNGQSAVDLYRLADEIADRCIPGLTPVRRDSGGACISGTFYSRATGRVISLLGHEGQQAVFMSGMTLPARRDTEQAITVPILPTDLIIRPVLGSGAAVDALQITEFGQVDWLARIDPSAGARAAEIAGEYSSPSAGICASISVSSDGDARMRLAGTSGAVEYKLTALGPALWQAISPLATPLGATLEVNERGFQLTTGRTVRLHFGRLTQ